MGQKGTFVNLLKQKKHLTHLNQMSFAPLRINTMSDNFLKKNTSKE